MFSVTLYTNAWYMETAEVAVHLIALLHPCGVLLVEKWPRIPPVGKTPPGKGPGLSTYDCAEGELAAATQSYSTLMESSTDKCVGE